MPDLTGLPILTAQSMLDRVGIKFGEPRFSGCSDSGSLFVWVCASACARLHGIWQCADSCGAIQRTSKPKSLPGSVLSQSPPAGYRVAVGSTVALTVAK
jgi:beta-lactam-binding protein with PASTA domain